ncbi:NADPH-dependent 2,4-dienoyl-CoA reductase [Vitreoscilla stercoraria]|uniref:NADPH-dependent 2,4-dienoyl-CoA reductase n=1 Tax=Vitreoscilla stercoraria TaxID=61 RepID=A0ABY4EC10_VITST|nr:NADPH-dependent 2,4-dienoyl-CoA reductase [Vitreoscilla stercoraria]UOO92764.1 NADPH-dependent 2,4-dienoyl-CoA reductase [Vitreoscilla stercoraria]
MPQALLGTPLPLHKHILRNRIIMGSMHTGFEEHAEGNEHLAAFYQARAEGGVALIITGGISPNEAGAVTEGGAKLTTDDEVKWHRLITDKVHEHDTKICMQILHTGRYAMSRQPVAPSAIQAPINPARPKALSTEEVKQTVQDYIRCAQLAQQAGYDGVEVMGSEGYLINQFIAQRTNQRDDEYGGSLENRHRFATEIVHGIRQTCGDDFIIIFRISVLDLVEHGSTWEDNLQLIQRIEHAGASIFNTGIGWHEARIPTIATMVPRAAFSNFTAKLKQASHLPVIATNRINMPDVAEQLLQDGIADAVCLARPMLADAQWSNKALAKRPESINTCIGCNQACLDHIFAGKLTSCLVNPFACHELQLIQKPAKNSKRIAVIGAGPAGLACAKTAAERGHHVTLFDAQSQIGGQLNIAKTVPGKQEFNETLRYFAHELSQLKVDVRLNAWADAAQLQDFDEIVLASGIHPRQVNIEGIDHPKVLSYLQVLRDKAHVGNKVIIIGSGGIGFDVAEFLSHQGEDSSQSPTLFQQEWQIDASLEQAGGLKSIEPQLTPSVRDITICQRKSGVVGRNLGKTTGWIHRLSLKEKGVNMLGGVTYLKIDDAGLHVQIGDQIQVLAADHIIICAGQESNRDLQDALNTLNKPVHIIGGADVATELDAKRAILSGTEVALAL